MDTRLLPPFWRHDAYTLNRLRAAISRCLQASPLTEGSVVVDMGAGAAPYQSLFATAGGRYVKCDLDDAEGAEVILQPGEPVALADHSADRVVSFQVLEHVWDIDWYIGQCHRLLKPDGSLLISTHGTWLFHPHPTDFRRWTRTGLVAELETRGFKVDEIHPVVGPLAWTTQFRTLGYHHVLGKLPVVGGILSALLCSIMHARMLLEDAVTPATQTQDNAAVYVLVARPKR